MRRSNARAHDCCLVLAIVVLCFVPPASASIDGGNETYQEEELQPLVLRAENQRLRQQLADQQVWGFLMCIHTRLYAGCREAVST